MSILYVYHVSSPDLPNKVLTHLEDIASSLAEHDVVVDRWQAASPVRAGASQDEVMGAYRAQIDQLMTEQGHRAVDVISVAGHPGQNADLRDGLLHEQQCNTRQAWHFVVGRGLLCLHLGDFVYAVQCEKNDRITLPAGVRHWFDIGEQSHLVLIRLFADETGVTATTTGDDVANQFPRLDD